MSKNAEIGGGLNIPSVSVVGGLIVIAGWIMMFFFTGIETESRVYGIRVPSEVFNMHRAMIANNVILLGYVLVVVGFLYELLAGSNGKVLNPAPAVAPTETVKAEFSASALDGVDLTVEQRVKAEEFFRGRFNVETVVRPNGEVLVISGSDQRAYPTLQAALKVFSGR